MLSKLRAAEAMQADGYTVAQACRRIGISEQTLYRWRRECSQAAQGLAAASPPGSASY
jgi:transposase-like protein